MINAISEVRILGPTEYGLYSESIDDRLVAISEEPGPSRRKTSSHCHKRRCAPDPTAHAAIREKPCTGRPQGAFLLFAASRAFISQLSL